MVRHLRQGADNLNMLAQEAGLYLGKVEGTYCPTGYTEQYNEAGIQGNTLLVNILKERRCGEVYQFVLTLTRDYCGETEYLFKAPSIQSHLYTDTGSGFNGKHRRTESQFFANLHSGIQLTANANQFHTTTVGIGNPPKPFIRFPFYPWAKLRPICALLILQSPFL